MSTLENIVHPKTVEGLIVSTMLLPLYEHVTSYHQGYISSKLKNGLYTSAEIILPMIKGAAYSAITIKAVEMMDYYNSSPKLTAFICTTGAVANVAINGLSYLAGKERVIPQKISKSLRKNIIFYSERDSKSTKNEPSK